MDEIEHKLKTNNSVLVVNAVDKLISSIKSKFKPAERQKFLLENEELKFLREKCSAKEAIVSLTACQGLLALVELGVLEIAHTMSTVVTLLPSAHNYSAIISTMTGLLILDLKSRLTPGQVYKCQFSLKSPQHPFITVLERNKGAEDDVFAQMQALCTHTDFTVSSNSLELLRPVFLYLTCHPQRAGSVRPWRLLLALPRTDAQCALLLACLSCQHICNPAMLERALSAYSAVADAAIYQRDELLLTALLPVLARISNELVKHGRDPRPCYNLIARCFALGLPGLRAAVGVTVHLLADNLPRASALHLHDTFNLCLNIISKYGCPSISLNAFVAQSLQWLHLPSYLTSSALKVASKMLDIYRDNIMEDNSLNIPNLMSNKNFQTLLYSDSKLSVTVKLHSVWERLRDDEIKLKNWLNGIQFVHETVKVDLLSFFYGILMEKNVCDDVVLKVLGFLVDLVDYKKDVSVELLPILLYKVANDVSPVVKFQCLKALPLMAKVKENVPTIVSILNKLKANRGLPTPVLISLYTSLAETQVRCFPYLQEMLIDPGLGRADDLKWEVDIARVLAVRRMCELRPSSHGLELVPIISSTLNRCTDKAGTVAACLALSSVGLLWRSAALSPQSAWRALEPKLARDKRDNVQIYTCKLVCELSSLQPGVETACACAALWRLLAEGPCAVAAEACAALAQYTVDHYELKGIPEIYRQTVKLPASFCKTPADAARKPEDVLDYIPCEIWPEVFKYTNRAALQAVSALAHRHVEREVKTFRSGVYQCSGREPSSLTSLPPKSVIRGLVDGLRKQVSCPSHECSEEATVAMVSALCGGARPLPPVDAHFLPSLISRGGLWTRGGVALAARQGKVSPSAKAVIEDWVLSIQTGTPDESDIILFYELLPTLTRNLPPNTLRGPFERTLADAFALIAQTKSKTDYSEHIIARTLSNLSRKKDQELASEVPFDVYKMWEGIEESDSLFVKQLKLVKRCLDCDIHDANRTLLSQLVEQYFAVIGDDNVSWPTYVDTCTSLSSACLERMTSPSSWWEAPPALLRKATSIRTAVAASPRPEDKVWLNEIIDAQAGEITEQESSIRMIFASLVAHAQLPTEWLLQLLARTQLAFNETKDPCSIRYLFAVFSACVCAWSGLWALEAAPPGLRPPPLLPAAVATLLDRDGAEAYARQMVEWVAYSRECVPPAQAASCQRALLAARAATHAKQLNVWMRLESHFGKDIVEED